ncbi:MAG: hypothetical protein AAF492_19755, partial [Verrucomicrobiota bacterium]
LLLTSCGGGAPPIPTPDKLEASIKIGDREVKLSQGFLYESPYSTSEQKEYDLILMEDEEKLKGFLSQMLKLKAPPITEHQQLTFVLRPIPESDEMDAEITLQHGSGDKNTVLSGFVPAAKATSGGSRYPGSYEISNKDGQPYWTLSLKTEDKKRDGTAYTVELEAKLPQLSVSYYSPLIS